MAARRLAAHAALPRRILHGDATSDIRMPPRITFKIFADFARRHFYVDGGFAAVKAYAHVDIATRACRRALPMAPPSLR